MNAPHLTIHPVWLRITHWLNALAVVVLMMSGWRIYNATSFLGFPIPAGTTLRIAATNSSGEFYDGQALHRHRY